MKSKISAGKNDNISLGYKKNVKSICVLRENLNVYFFKDVVVILLNLTGAVVMHKL